MLWRIDIAARPGRPNPAAASALAGLREIGGRLERVDAIQVYLVEGEIDRQAAERIARDAILDPVTETCRVGPAGEPPAPSVDRKRSGGRHGRYTTRWHC